MTDAENPEIKKTDIEVVLAQFDAKEDMLAALCAKTKLLIEAILQDANIRYHSIQDRVKNRKKLREKYLDPTKDYRCLDDITDLAGLRVITYYEDDIDRVAEVVKREFIIDEKNSVDKRDTDPDRFSYSALNYVCAHLERRATDVEYKKFANTCCEIQVTSILRHAWSEIEHEWYDLKEAYPKEIKRRFYRLAALLELAESEFLDLRKSKTQYERSVSVRIGASLLDLPVDAVSIRSFMEQDPLVAEMDRSIATMWGTSLSDEIPDSLAEVRSKAANLSGLARLQDVRDYLERYRPEVLDFAHTCNEELWASSRRPGTRVNKGLSIYQMALMLAGAQGAEPVRNFLVSIGVRSAIPWDVERMSVIAKAALQKREGRR
jgi:putative GTP pyrophosphokinase